jgi:hypothetical protein
MAMRFVRLTRGQQHIWVNPAAITWVGIGAKGGAVVSFMGDKNDYIAVSETPDQVAQLAASALAGEG